MALPLDLALTSAGYNARTGRYGFSRAANGDVLFDLTQAYPVMSAVVCRRNAYWADRNFGSGLLQLRNLSSRTPSQAVAVVLDAIAPLEQAPLNLVASTAAQARAGTAREGKPNALIVDLDWTTPGGLNGSGSVLG